MRAFVTGGTGFVGSHLVEELLRRGVDVRALVRSDPKWLAGLPVERLPGGLDDVAALQEALRDVDVVFHVGGLTRAPSEAPLFEANVEATRRLLDAAREAGVRRVIVTSSQAAAGPSGPQPIDEASPKRPVSAYGRSKAAMEEAVAQHPMAERSVIIRPPSVYGPREADIYTMIRAAARQRVYPIIGDAREPAVSLVHVRDLVRGMADAAESEAAAGRTYFLVGPRDYSWDEFREALEGALGHRLIKVPIPRSLVLPAGVLAEGIGRLAGRYPPMNREKAREIRERWLASHARAASDFGYRPEIELADGLREAVEWYRQNGWL